MKHKIILVIATITLLLTGCENDLSKNNEMTLSELMKKNESVIFYYYRTLRLRDGSQPDSAEVVGNGCYSYYTLWDYNDEKYTIDYLSSKTDEELIEEFNGFPDKEKSSYSGKYAIVIETVNGNINQEHLVMYDDNIKEWNYVFSITSEDYSSSFVVDGTKYTGIYKLLNDVAKSFENSSQKEYDYWYRTDNDILITTDSLNSKDKHILIDPSEKEIDDYFSSEN